MMKKTLYIFIVLLVVGAAIFWYLSDKSQSVHSSIEPELVSIKKDLIALQKDKKNTQLTEKEHLEKTHEILNKLPDTHKRLKHIYKIATSPLPEIMFYGRLIDQYEKPVKNASVGYTGENAHLSKGGGMGIVKTDDDGYFIINTTGAALELSGVRHPEIEAVSYEAPTKNMNSTRNVRESTIRFLQHDNNEYSLNWRNHTEKNKAYIVRANRLGEYQGAVKGGTTTYHNLDGRQYTLSLLEKKFKRRVKEGVHDGHFIVSCTRKATMKNHRDYGDWTTTISPINGGIQETNDIYMSEAPASGYKPSISFDMKIGSDDYEFRVLNRRYYFTANNGETYGSLFMHFEPHAKYKDKLCGISFNKYRINPTGSRSLVLKNSTIN